MFYPSMEIQHGAETRNSVREHRSAELFRLIRTEARVRATFDATVMERVTRKRIKPIVTVEAADEKACKATARMKLRSLYDPERFKITRLAPRDVEYLLDSDD